MYVARGNAKATRGAMTVTADILTAHEREKQPARRNSPKPPPAIKSGAGDIDLMTAEGHVVILDTRQRITGEHAVYDLDKHKMIVTGAICVTKTAKEVVTATDSLEYYEDTKLAVARAMPSADQPTRHIEGDILTAEFRDAPNGQTQLTKMTSQGHVTVITKARKPTMPCRPKTASQNPKIPKAAMFPAATARFTTRQQHGHPHRRCAHYAERRTELSGDVGEVDFNNNQNRLMNNGSGRVRACCLKKPPTRLRARPGGRTMTKPPEKSFPSVGSKVR